MLEIEYLSDKYKELAFEKFTVKDNTVTTVTVNKRKLDDSVKRLAKYGCNKELCLWIGRKINRVKKKREIYIMYDKKNRPIFGCSIKNKYKKLGIYDEEEKKINVPKYCFNNCRIPEVWSQENKKLDVACDGSLKKFEKLKKEKYCKVALVSLTLCDSKIVIEFLKEKLKETGQKGHEKFFISCFGNEKNFNFCKKAGFTQINLQFRNLDAAKKNDVSLPIEICGIKMDMVIETPFLKLGKLKHEKEIVRNLVPVPEVVGFFAENSATDTRIKINETEKNTVKCLNEMFEVARRRTGLKYTFAFKVNTKKVKSASDAGSDISNNSKKKLEEKNELNSKEIFKGQLNNNSDKKIVKKFSNTPIITAPAAPANQALLRTRYPKTYVKKTESANLLERPAQTPAAMAKTQAAKTKDIAAKTRAGFNDTNLNSTVRKYILPTYIGYIENNNVFQIRELSENSEQLKKFLKKKPQTSPIIISNSDSYHNLMNEPYSKPVKISKQFKNTSDTNTSIDNLIDNLKQTGKDADIKIKQYVNVNFIKYESLLNDIEIVRENFETIE
jgi:hypothetical protein